MPQSPGSGVDRVAEENHTRVTRRLRPRRRSPGAFKEPATRSLLGSESDPSSAESPGSRTPPRASSTEVHGVSESPGPGSAGGVPRPGAPVPAAAASLAAAPVAAPASQFTLLVMRPCAGPEEAEGCLRQVPAPAPARGGGPCKPLGYLCEVAGEAEEEAAEDDADLLDTSDPPGGGESTASLEDLEDEDAHSGGEGGGGARRRGGGASKTCTYQGCSETTSQVAKQRKPWMCKKHRNKMYKDKYKKKKSDQALNCSGAATSAGSASNVKVEETADNILSIVKQRTGSFGDRPARPTLLEQVLNQKRLSLLRSPEVVQFLQKQQQLLNQQVLEQRQQQFPGASV
ncbi:regulatory factor X-associated protein [Perognathus longimembris pacificus]|uniref:regulatory factor X-associated protein n=1 Tax=Perognathus longimembris pacificus TaxID=214514 RepID=UPI002019962E|nr:regulatory factor X-associated protein [Perognathus longimembris pacificus]